MYSIFNLVNLFVTFLFSAERTQRLKEFCQAFGDNSSLKIQKLTYFLKRRGSKMKRAAYSEMM